ncbi:molybdenum cofactor guanylyltransferase [Candidatus Bathyarchaeota archaeon]|nr:molybdenum cofactor guanylyltransferase [Candidatus Bathyarchaeota archaeon]
MKKTAIILAGGTSHRLGQDKGLMPLGSKPLIMHILDRVCPSVDERIVVINSAAQMESYTKILGSDVQLVVLRNRVQMPLAGALAGFEKSTGEYSLLLPCDAPFISEEVIKILFELCVGKSAAIPRWPNGNLEPLQAVYRTSNACVAAKEALLSGHTDVRSMISNLKGVRYISTLVIQQLDPPLYTFLNVNTPQDFKKAESLLKRLVSSQPLN